MQKERMQNIEKENRLTILIIINSIPVFAFFKFFLPQPIHFLFCLYLLLCSFQQLVRSPRLVCHLQEQFAALLVSQSVSLLSIQFSSFSLFLLRNKIKTWVNIDRESVIRLNLGKSQSKPSPLRLNTISAMYRLKNMWQSFIESLTQWSITLQDIYSHCLATFR